MTYPLQPSRKSLEISRTVLRWLVKLNLILGFLIFALLVASIISGSFVIRALGVLPNPDTGRLLLAMRGIMVVGILATPVMHLIFTRLLSLVETVRAGDPFIVENADRLQTIALSIVGLELMHLVVVVLANDVWVGPQTMYVGRAFSVTPWLTILLLFVLAQVFAQGARMREDLAGTV